MGEAFSWQAPEFKSYEKNQAWYITFGLIVLLVLVFQLIQADWFGAFTTALIAGLLVAFMRRKPNIINIKLDNIGVTIQNNLIVYKSIKHFWIVNNFHHRTLNIETTAYINNVIILELQDQDPEAVRRFLRAHISEHESTEETMTQRLMRQLKL
jgi:hypothetical protein